MMPEPCRPSTQLTLWCTNYYQFGMPHTRAKHIGRTTNSQFFEHDSCDAFPQSAIEVPLHKYNHLLTERSILLV